MFKAAVNHQAVWYSPLCLMRSVHIIGVSLDLGGNRRGVDMGPSAFRIAGLGERLVALGATVVDAGDLVAPIPETKSFGDPGKKYIREIARVCEKLYKTSLTSLEKIQGWPEATRSAALRLTRTEVNASPGAGRCGRPWKDEWRTAWT